MRRGAKPRAVWCEEDQALFIPNGLIFKRRKRRPMSAEMRRKMRYFRKMLRIDAHFRLLKRMQNAV